MITLGTYIDENLISIKDITNYMLWNVVNAFMKCFEPLFELIIPTYKNLHTIKIILNKNTKINIGCFLKEGIKYVIMLTIIYYINGPQKLNIK